MFPHRFLLVLTGRLGYKSVTLFCVSCVLTSILLYLFKRKSPLTPVSNSLLKNIILASLQHILVFCGVAVLD